MNTTIQQVELGKTGMLISQLGIGAWAWGDKLFWGYGKDYGEPEIQQVFERCVEAGITFFDTAEIYGMGRSERILGELAASTDSALVLASKFYPYPWRLHRSAMRQALERSLSRIESGSLDLYQIHFPRSPLSPETWTGALAELVESGLVRAAGVSNFDTSQMLRAQSVLAERGLPLASNQVEYSLLNRRVETSGLLRTCLDEQTTLIAYSPIAQGVLTGKYTPENPLHGYRRLKYPPSVLSRVKPLLGLMSEIGRGHSGKTSAQVALNWVICKGAIPIPGVKNLRQLEEILGAVGWSLTADELAALDAESARLA